jgi:hypothetical protein
MSSICAGDVVVAIRHLEVELGSMKRMEDAAQLHDLEVFQLSDHSNIGFGLLRL